MGTLYVVGVPEGDPTRVTLRARRILGQVAFIVAGDVGQAWHLLARCGIATPLVDVVHADASLDRLQRHDVAVLHSGWSPAPMGAVSQFIRAAIERGFPVVPIPSSSLVVAALVISGLPADSFVYLGELPSQPIARRDLLALIADESRTLVALEWPARLSETLMDLQSALGHRPLVAVAATEEGIVAAWRGTIDETPASLLDRPCQGPYILVLGRALEKTPRWDQARLGAEVRACLARGLGAKEISQQLAAESGWPRREIYRLVVKAAGFSSAENL